MGMLPEFPLTNFMILMGRDPMIIEHGNLVIKTHNTIAESLSEGDLDRLKREVSANIESPYLR